MKHPVEPTMRKVNVTWRRLRDTRTACQASSCELAIRRLHQSLEGTGAQVDDQGTRPRFQRQVDVVGRLAGVQQETVSLQRSEGQGDFICAALDRLLGQS